MNVEVRGVERLNIEGSAGAIETVIEDPGAASDRFAVVCHPHPLFGGTMDNKVVTTLARAMHECGVPTLRFNFRGVGASAGDFDGGDAESDDAIRVADVGFARWPGRRLIVAGFSFGSFVAARLARSRPAERLISIAPPVERFDFSSVVPPPCPWLVVQGDADEVVDPKAVIRWAGGLRPAPQLVVMPGVGHFFHGHLLELRGVVIETLRGGQVSSTAPGTDADS